jgi:hypothetical protein
MLHDTPAENDFLSAIDLAHSEDRAKLPAIHDLLFNVKTYITDNLLYTGVVSRN